MRGNKQVFTQFPRLQPFALSAFIVSPLALALLPGSVSTAPPPFNIVISNVPGPPEPLYRRGARLDGNYPLSIALDGQALNITVVNNADNLDFGLVGCRRSVPHLQRLTRPPRDLAEGFGTRGQSLTPVPKLSAGLLLYRVRDGVVDVLIAHPGGPFWARKDDGAWSIPKGGVLAE